MSQHSGAQTSKKTAQGFTPVRTGTLQRQCACGQHSPGGGECEACREKGEKTLQRSAIGAVTTDTVPTIVHKVLNAPSQPLDAGARAYMEPRFGHDFSRVRVHTGSMAAESARAVNARAYTVGHDVVFGAGKYTPATTAGRALIAHELTHVVQHDRTPPGTSGPVLARAQEPTLSEAAKTGTPLKKQALSRMDVLTLASMPPDQRKAFYVDKLGPFENQLRESAGVHFIPVQLLALVILNELADISLADLLQSDMAVTSGSLGIAQIQIDTAMKDNLFPDLTKQEGEAAYNEFISSLPSPKSRLAARLMRTEDKEKRLAINRRLQIPQHAIDAAGREIRMLLNQMMANTGAAWQTKFGFTHKGVAVPLGAQAIYDDIAGGSQRDKELNLAHMVTGAYNSPKVITAANPDMANFPNANIHGTNSERIAADLFDFGLFRP